MALSTVDGVLREHLIIERRGARLAAIVERPAAVPGPVPGVLFFHGLTGHMGEGRRLFVRMARRLVQAGIGCLRFDHVGAGESSGDYREFTWEGWQADVAAAVAAFEALPWRDPAPAATAVLGYSFGGASAATALEIGWRGGPGGLFGAACLWAPAIDLPSLNRNLVPAAAQAALQRDGYLDVGGYQIARELLAAAGAVAAGGADDPAAAWAKWPAPMAIFHGREDAVLPWQASAALAEARERDGHPTMLRVMDEGCHGFGEWTTAEALIADSASWLAARLKGPASAV